MALLAGIQSARAETLTWVGSNLADWGVASNWNPARVPLTGDDVVLGGSRARVVGTQSVGTIELTIGSLNIDAGGKLTFQTVDQGDSAGSIVNNGQVIGSVGELEGVLQNYGTWVGDVENNIDTINSYGTWTGIVELNTGRIQNMEGGSWTGNVLENAEDGYIVNMDGSTWTGDVIENAGVIDNFDLTDKWYGHILSNSNDIFNGGLWEGNIVTNGDYISNYYAGSVWNGDVQSNAVVVYNAGTWNGNIQGNSGNIENGSFANNDLDSIWNGDVWANAGTISSIGIWNGSLTSAGTLVLENQVNGAIANGGTLQLSADLSGITSLTNTGTLEMTYRTGVQALSAQSASFGTDGTLLIDADATGASDRIALTGAAVLGGVVNVTAVPGSYDPHTSYEYTIVDAGSIAGQFDGVAVDLAYLSPRLTQDATSVTLSLKRNDVGFESLGTTPTQIAIGTIVENLGAGNALYDGVLWLNADEAAAAFDTLSGASYLATEQAMIQSAALVAGSVADHIDQSFDTLGATGDSASSYAATAAPQVETAPNKGLWGELYGASSASSGAGAPESAMAAGGLVAGLDSMVGDWRVGMMLNAGTTRSEIAAQGASTTSTDLGLGIYAGREWDNTRLALGATFTSHDTASSRTVAFTDFSETLTASYGAASALAFAELSHDFDLGALSITPFGSLTHVRHATDGFTESGGEAALSGGSSVVDATFAAIGVGVSRQMAFDNGVLVTAGASLGWRRTFAEQSAATHYFLTGGSFSVAGAPVETDAVLLGADLAFDLDATNAIDLRYDGRLGSGTSAHALNLGWTSRF